MGRNLVNHVDKMYEPYIDGAREYYRKMYNSYTSEKRRTQMLGTLKYYDMLRERMHGATYYELAFDYDMDAGNIRSMILTVYNRVIRFSRFNKDKI